MKKEMGTGEWERRKCLRKERKTEENLWMYVCVRERRREENVCEKQRAREASVTDSAEAAVKGSSNTAGGEEIGAKKPEGYTLLEERKRG